MQGGRFHFLGGAMTLATPQVSASHNRARHRHFDCGAFVHQRVDRALLQ
jgi:hypothetical protein